MVRKLSIKQSSKPILNCEPLQELVAELTEQNQETISGGRGSGTEQLLGAYNFFGNQRSIAKE